MTSWISPNNTLMMVPPALPIIGLAPFVKPINLYTPTINNGFAKVRQYLNPNDDPELHHNVIKHYFNKLRDVWFETSFAKLLRFIKIENGKAVIVKTEEEAENNGDKANGKIKLEFILSQVFSKYDMESLLEKVAFENMVNWYDMKSKHNDLIKKEIYRKIKHRLTRHF